MTALVVLLTSLKVAEAALGIVLSLGRKVSEGGGTATVKGYEPQSTSLPPGFQNRETSCPGVLTSYSYQMEKAPVELPQPSRRASNILSGIVYLVLKNLIRLRKRLL